MREMKQTMAAVLSLTLACTLLIAPAEITLLPKRR